MTLVFGPERLLPPALELPAKMTLLCGPDRFMHSLFVSLVIVALCNAKKKECGLPEVPPHGIFQCLPPLCQGPLYSGMFKSDTVVQLKCQPGYSLTSEPAFFICHDGQWNMVRDGVCWPRGTSPVPHSNILAAASIPVILAAAMTFSVLLVAVVWCALVKPRISICRCTSGGRGYEDLDDWDTVDHVQEVAANRVSTLVWPLPSYEEAVYGYMGTPLPMDRWGPTPPVLAEDVLSQPELSGPSHVAGGTLEVVVSSPPSYQEALAAATPAEEERIPGGEQPLRNTGQCLPPSPGNKSGF